MKISDINDIPILISVSQCWEFHMQLLSTRALLKRRIFHQDNGISYY